MECTKKKYIAFKLAMKQHIGLGGRFLVYLSRGWMMNKKAHFLPWKEGGWSTDPERVSQPSSISNSTTYERETTATEAYESEFEAIALAKAELFWGS